MSERFMNHAIELALENVRQGRGGPFAALVVRDGVVIASGTNQVASSNDPTAHAEMVAIREACRKLGTFQLTACDVYTTCEPCPMCLGAIYWARPARVFFAGTRDDAAAAGFDDSFIYAECCRSLGERAIAMVPLLRAEGRRILEEWKRHPGRVPY